MSQMVVPIREPQASFGQNSLRPCAEALQCHPSKHISEATIRLPPKRLLPEPSMIPPVPPMRRPAPELAPQTCPTQEETAVREPTVLEVFDAPAFTVCLGRIELLPNKPAQKTPSYMYWAAGGASAALLATRRAPELSTPWTYLEVNGDSHWSVKLAGVELKHITEDEHHDVGFFRCFLFLPRSSSG